MVEQFAQDFIRRIPLGYLCARLIRDEASRAVDGIFLDANSAFERAAGVEPGRLIGKKVSEIFPSQLRDWPDFFEQLENSGQVRERDLEFAKIGRWLRIGAFLLREDSFALMLQDVTEEKKNLQEFERQKRELESAHAELEFIFNSTQDALFLAEYRDGEIYYQRINAAEQEMFDLGDREVVGKTPPEVWGEETGGPMREAYRQAARLNEAQIYEETLNLSSGTRTFLTSLKAVERDGKRYLIGSRKDITEFKHLQSDHSALVRRLESMFHEHLAMMMILDAETGQVVDVNPSACNFYGFTKEEFLQMNIREIDLQPPEEIEQHLQLTAVRGIGNFIVPHRLKSGEIRLIDVYSCPIGSSDEHLVYAIEFDVTDREKYREDLYNQEELLSTTLKSIGDGVVTTDVDGKITSVNQAAEEIVLWKNDEIYGKDFAEMFILKSEETGKLVENPVEKVLRTGRIIGLANHTVLENRDGEEIPVADSTAPIRGEDGKVLGVVMVFRDVRKEKEQQQEIVFLSYHDALTGLYNRRFLESQIQRLDAATRTPVTAVMGDVNGLKIANDVFSHEMGDRLLRSVADVMRENCGKEDIIARWGGDEFLILRPNSTLAETEQLVQKMQEEFRRKSAGALQLSVSLGCAERTDGEPISAVVQQAEEWMYHQKLLEGKSYRNTIINTMLATLYEKSMETEEHGQRLVKYCQAVGRELKFSDKAQNELSLLAVLHDIGKVGIHQSVLQKPGPLTPEEWKEMKRHPEIGYRIAQNTPELATVSEYILYHHERWDGTGYPRGLKGEEIPLNCRILAVADSYDAMTSDRIYRKALSREDAVAELLRNAGTQFDPQIAEIFVWLLARGEFRDEEPHAEPAQESQ